MIAIVNYNMGNMGSVAKKLQKIGCEFIVTSTPEQILACSKIILPGVGHFTMGVNNLKKMELWDTLNEVVIKRKTPILGICLGMQLFALKSEEGNTEGLGWIDANVVSFSVSDPYKYKVPHTGWNQIKPMKESKLLEGIKSTDEFYFVHKYHYANTELNAVLTETEYDYDFVSTIEKGHIYGVQFHPEKSHAAGELLLRNFVDL